MRFVVAAALLWIPLHAQDAFLAGHTQARSAQNPAVTFQIAAPKNTFYLGELIPLTLSFTASQPRSFLAEARLNDRVGRLNFVEEFLVDPISGTEDPLRGLPGEKSGIGGLSGGLAILTSAKPFQIERFLNEWIRFRQPGTYRLYLRSHRVRQVNGEGLSDLELQLSHGPSIETVSNILTLQVLPAPAEWVSQQIRDATSVLNGHLTTNENVQARVRAASVLRFLNTPESAAAIVANLARPDGNESFALHFGVLDSSYRATLLPQLEQQLIDPSTSIPERYLATMAQLAVLVESGGYPTQASLDQKRNQYVATLAANVSRKEPSARANTRQALLALAENAGERPAWYPAMARALVEDFRLLSPQARANLIDTRWLLIRGAPNVLPMLNDLYENPPAPEPNQTRALILRRIAELDPERGRQLALAELHRPEGPRFQSAVMMSLPEENLPDLDPILAAQLARGQYDVTLIARYASPALLPNVKAALAERRANMARHNIRECQFPIAFYFLKYDAAFGEAQVRDAFYNGPCYDMSRALDGIGPKAWTPNLEQLAIAHLNVAAPVIARRGAAEALGKYGSTAAREPLWEIMEYFHSYWKDRAAELRRDSGREGLFFERAIRIALAQASGWVFDEPELNRLATFCTSGECEGAVRQWLVEARDKQVEVMPFGGDIRYKIAQYTPLSEADAVAKLKQYPAGTTFHLRPVRNEDLREAQARFEAAIRAAGHRIAP